MIQEHWLFAMLNNGDHCGLTLTRLLRSSRSAADAVVGSTRPSKWTCYMLEPMEFL